jgi:hypothetical protein
VEDGIEGAKNWQRVKTETYKSLEKFGNIQTQSNPSVSLSLPIAPSSQHKYPHLSVSPEFESVSVLPGSVRRASLDVVGLVTSLSETSALSAGRSQTSHLSVLVHRVTDPVDSSIISDGIVGRIHNNHLVVLVSSVLVHPVRVQHSHVAASLAHSLLSHRLKVSGELQLVDTMVLGLSEHNTSGIRSLSASSLHGTSEYDVTLLGFVSQLSSLLRSSGLGKSHDSGSLSVFPGSDSKQKSHNITLLVTPHLFHVLVSSHI